MSNAGKRTFDDRYSCSVREETLSRTNCANCANSSASAPSQWRRCSADATSSSLAASLLPVDDSSSCKAWRMRLRSSSAMRGSEEGPIGASTCNRSSTSSHASSSASATINMNFWLFGDGVGRRKGATISEADGGSGSPGNAIRPTARDAFRAAAREAVRDAAPSASDGPRYEKIESRSSMPLVMSRATRRARNSGVVPASYTWPRTKPSCAANASCLKSGRRCWSSASTRGVLVARSSADPRPAPAASRTSCCTRLGSREKVPMRWRRSAAADATQLSSSHPTTAKRYAIVLAYPSLAS
mmetsp:Transcript_3012/g.9852  ORF Transcript_3012/g.9852 Transcript_3012/m.9852 type:complete len:300 (+) Transcript_3012:698-1597(+)